MNNAVEKLRAKVERLSKLDTEGYPASEYTWHEHVNEIRRLILEDDPEIFLTWRPIASTMACRGHSDWTRASRGFLQSLPDWETRWKSAIAEVQVGAPAFQGVSPPTSNALAITVHCLALFEQEMQVKVNELGLILEFGGGYGCMARLLRELGFEGRYLDYDFPVIAALAEYYLAEVGRLAKDGKMFQSWRWNAHTFYFSDMSDIKAFLSEPGPTNSLFLSTWALSEAPLDTRLEILSLVKKFRYFYVVYQPEFYEADNDRFFARVPGMMQGWQWKHWEIEHLGARALAGVKI